MFEFISRQEICHHIFDRHEMADKASTILEALLEARLPRLSDLSHTMPGNPAANYKAIQHAVIDGQREGAHWLNSYLTLNGNRPVGYPPHSQSHWLRRNADISHSPIVCSNQLSKNINFPIVV